MTLPTHPVAGVIALTVIFQACFSNAFSVRDSDGVWRSLSWGKRSNPGDVIRIPLRNNNDKSYSLPVRMGTPFQEVEMAVSLSQNYILVATPETPGQPGFYNPSISQSFVQGAAIASTTLDSQPVNVAFSGESCQILDFSYNASLAITPFNASTNLYREGTYGVLGYGVDAPSGVPADSTLLGVYFPPNITTLRCGIDLGRVADGSGGGVLTMGARDPTAWTGNFTTMVVPPAETISRPSWTIPVDRIAAGSTGNMQSIFSTQGLASIDPYYPSITLPSEAVTLLYSRVAQAAVSSGNSNRYTVPCDANIQITMTFGGRDFTIDPRDAITREGDTCFGTVEIGDGNIFKFGNPFLRNVYTSFDATFSGSAANFTVGFADKATSTSNTNVAVAKTAPSTALSILFSLLGISLVQA